MASSLTSTRTVATRRRLNLDRRLSAYLAASASIGAVAASEALGVVISDQSDQSFGINGDVNIDFNSDGQIDYQIDHDRFNLGGTLLDYLQIDKNNASSAENPYPIDNFSVFDLNGTPANSDHEFLTAAGPGESGYYPSALTSGTLIGPASTRWEIYQEGENFLGSHRIIRPNRLIDEDATQIDNANPNPSPGVVGTFPPFGTPGWVGLAGQTRYLGLRIDLNDAGDEGFNNGIGSAYWYGYIGVRITNEADATGAVVQWGYESVQGASITAGQVGFNPGDANFDQKVDAADYVALRKSNASPARLAVWESNYGENSWVPSGSSIGLNPAAPGVPEPGSLLLTAIGGAAMLGAFLFRRIRRS